MLTCRKIEYMKAKLQFSEQATSQSISPRETSPSAWSSHVHIYHQTIHLLTFLMETLKPLS